MSHAMTLIAEVLAAKCWQQCKADMREHTPLRDTQPVVIVLDSTACRTRAPRVSYMHATLIIINRVTASPAKLPHAAGPMADLASTYSTCPYIMLADG